MASIINSRARFISRLKPSFIHKIAAPLLITALVVLSVVALQMRLSTLNGVAIDYQDEGVYWQSLRLMDRGYPLFTSIFSSQPPFFLLGVHALYGLFGQSLPGARFAVALFSIVGIGAFYMLAATMSGRVLGLVAAILLVADPLYFSASHTLQAEGPAVVWEIIAVACVGSAVITSSGRQFLLFLSGIALVCGTLTKLFDIVALAPVASFLVLSAFGIYDDSPVFGTTPRQVRARRLVNDGAFFAAGALLATMLILAPFWSNRYKAWDQVVTFHRVVSHTFLNTGLSANIKLVTTTISATYPLPYLLLVGVAILVAIVLKQWTILAPLAWLAASLAFLLQQQPLLGHQFSLLAPPLALIGAATIMPVLMRVTVSALVATATAFILIFATLTTLVPNVQKLQAEASAPVPATLLTLAHSLAKRTSAADLIATDDQYVAGLANRSVVPELVDTSQVRIVTGYVDAHYMAAPWMENVLRRDHVRVILAAGHRFPLVPGFMMWLRSHYHPVTNVGDGQSLWIKD